MALNAFNKLTRDPLSTLFTDRLFAGKATTKYNSPTARDGNKKIGEPYYCTLYNL
jgi:hypothetical protein